MGLYDTLTVHERHGLPPGEYQTKDMDAYCHLYDLRIEENGRLMVREFDRERIPHTHRFKRVNHRWVDTNHHGALSFYDGKREYLAIFDNGELESIKQLA